MSFVCQFCELELTSVKEYLGHYRLHANVKNIIFPCCYDNCQFKFVRFTSLKSHMTRSHSFKQDNSLILKRMSKLTCEVKECGQNVFGFKNLISHVKTHINGSEAVSCPFSNCSKTFKVKSSFTSHVSRNHNHQSCSNQVSIITENVKNCTTNCYSLDEIEEENNALSSTITNSGDYTNHFALFLMKLEAMHLVPVSTIDSILSDVSHLHTLSMDMLKSQLRSQFLSLNIKDNTVITLLKEVFENDDMFSKLLSTSSKEHFSSDFKRKEFFKSNFNFIEPIEINLGLNESNKQSVFHYIPLVDTLETVILNRSVQTQLKNPIPSSNEGIYYDLIDGESFKNNEYFMQNPAAIKLALYQDAFEIVNPLGSAKKTFKILAFYFTFIDIYPQYRSKVDGLQLALLCRETDFEYFGCRVLEPLINDLKKLSVGVHLKNGNLLQANIACIIGDNLGSHLLGGFVTNFGNSEYFCRYCLIQRGGYEHDPLCTRNALLRTKKNYDDCVEFVKEYNVIHKMGVKSECLFNILDGFHVLNPGLPPCVGHDLFEGVIKYDLAIFLKELITKHRWFNVKIVNHKIRSLLLKGSDIGNRPALLKDDMSCLKGHAVQNWSFLRFLPILIGEYIENTEDDIWMLILNLRKMTELICSYKISINQVAVLQRLIEEYIDLRITLFPDIKLRPKHHYLQHFPWLITQFGPLLHVWTMRFESKHTYFKRCIRSSKNFVNVTKSLANKHQLLQAYYHAGNLFPNNILYENVIEVNVSMLDERMAQCISLLFPNLQSVNITDFVKVHEVSIKKGMFVIIDVESCLVGIGRVEFCVISPNEQPYLVCEYYKTDRSDLGVYEIDEPCKCILVHVNDLLDRFPLSAYNISGKTVVMLKSFPFDPMIPE